jgi:hypothetical protein
LGFDAQACVCALDWAQASILCRALINNLFAWSLERLGDASASFLPLAVLRHSARHHTMVGKGSAYISASTPNDTGSDRCMDEKHYHSEKHAL